MSNIVDLNILFPEEKEINIEAKDGKKYKFKVSIPNRLALEFIKIYSEKDDTKGEFELALDLVYKLLIITYPEITKDSDLYEFMLLDAHRKGYKFGWVQNPMMLKIEGNSIRDVSKAKAIKKKLYKGYGIEI